MAALRKSKTTAAAKAALERAQGFEAVGLQPASAFLAANADVAVQRNTQSTVQSARREDAFDALKAKMQAGAYDAARRLEKDLRTRRGEDDRGRKLFVVDASKAKDAMDRRLEAGDRVDAVLLGVGERDAWLLVELVYPVGPRDTWRDTVTFVTGETNEAAQGAAVRSACANLARSYDSKGYGDRLERMRARGGGRVEA